MTKFKTLLTVFALSELFISCNNNVKSKTKADSSTPNAIEYPFAYIDTKKEVRKNDNNYNEMLLYACGEKPSHDTLQMFCLEKKKEFTDGVFHIIAFFDKQVNSKFPTNPITGGYMDEIPARHIKAIYTYNRVNGYSKLDYYEKNSWEGTPVTTEIN
jgi:hypothetical protein